MAKQELQQLAMPPLPLPEVEFQPEPQPEADARPARPIRAVALYILVKKKRYTSKKKKQSSYQILICMLFIEAYILPPGLVDPLPCLLTFSVHAGLFEYTHPGTLACPLCGVGCK